MRREWRLIFTTVSLTLFRVNSAACREDRKKCVRLVREKRINGERIDAMREHVEVMLEKKFGRHVSVVKLESLIVDPHVVELHQDQQDFALACGRELKDWNVRASPTLQSLGVGIF